MHPETPQGWQAVDAAYAAVKAFPPRDQVTATTWAVVAVLSAMREKSKDVYEVRRAFNQTCDEALVYLQQQIASLRFPTTRRAGAERTWILFASPSRLIQRTPSKRGSAIAWQKPSKAMRSLPIS